jgi:hypothetical protein
VTPPFTLQIAGVEDRIRIDGGQLHHSIDPPVYEWSVTVDHEVPVAVPALPRQKRQVWVRNPEGVVICAAEVMVGWAAVEAGDRLHFSCYYDEAEEMEEDHPEPPQRQRSAIGGRR